MKILFIYPSNDPSYPLQLGCLSSYVKKFGHESRLLMLILPKGLTGSDIESVKKEVEDFGPDYIGFSCYETAWPWISKISIFIKENWPDIKIIAGGYYPTLVPDEAIAHPFIDVVCRGEGEKPLCELLDSGGSRTDIKNLWFKNSEGIIQNPIRNLITNLDELPFPDREMLDYQSHLDLRPVGEREIKVMATRGCLYNCTYCSNRYLRGIYPDQDHYLRYRSPENVISEIKELKSKFKFEKVGFHDDNLTLDLDWLRKFTKLYKQEIGLPFYAASRMERCTEEILDLLKDAGCELMLIGIESGDENYRHDMMKRFMSNKAIIEVFRRIRKKGMLTWSFTMVGLPLETRMMVYKTFWLNLRCRPDFVMASIFYPLKGTDLGNICYENGWINQEKKNRITSYAWETVLDHPNFYPWEIQIYKYLNIFTAAGSPMFWKIVALRLKELVRVKN